MKRRNRWLCWKLCPGSRLCPGDEIIYVTMSTKSPSPTMASTTSPHATIVVAVEMLEQMNAAKTEKSVADEPIDGAGKLQASRPTCTCRRAGGFTHLYAALTPEPFAKKYRKGVWRRRHSIRMRPEDAEAQTNPTSHKLLTITQSHHQPSRKSLLRYLNRLVVTFVAVVYRRQKNQAERTIP